MNSLCDIEVEGDAIFPDVEDYFGRGVWKKEFS
jgi:hypothetical protein